MRNLGLRHSFLAAFLFFTLLPAMAEAGTPSEGFEVPLYLLLLFLFCCVLGVVAVLGGVGGGVLYVPLVSAVFPFHMDYVRSTGLLVALALSLTAIPALLKQGFASLKLTLPFSLVSSIFAVLGALAALSVSQDIAKISMGCLILLIAVVMFRTKKSEHPEVEKIGPVAQFFEMEGYYLCDRKKDLVHWKVKNVRYALPLFCVIGFVAGMFGMGAGWANIPVLNLLIGAPLKVSVGTSLMLISITDTSAAWVYLNSGAVMAAIAVPSMLGIMIGSRLGVKLLPRVHSATVRLIVLSILVVSGLLSLTKGLHLF